MRGQFVVVLEDFLDIIFTKAVVTCSRARASRSWLSSCNRLLGLDAGVGHATTSP